MRNLTGQDFASPTLNSGAAVATRPRRSGHQRKTLGRHMVALGLSLALAACGNEKLLPDATLSGATKTSTSAYNLAATKDDTKAFNPFGEPSTSVKQRIVIKNPTLEQVLKPGPLPEISLGRTDAPVTLIKYASLTCPYCRKFHQEVFPKLKRNYIDTGKLRLIIREFPIGRSSGNATIALRCADPKKQLSLYGKFMSQQKSWVSQQVRLDEIYKITKQVGLSRAKFDACLQNQDMIANLNQVKDRGRTLGVIGTPNFFIQNQLVKSVLTYDELSERIETQLKAPSRSASTSNG